MKHHCVWEANRKVFFWPENWTEPALRDDKSPFFKDPENEFAPERRHRGERRDCAAELHGKR
jgi:hypothetical protein